MSEKKSKCAICDSVIVDLYKPFCSKRCADIDLHRWFTGGYAIPASDEDETVSEETE